MKPTSAKQQTVLTTLFLLMTNRKNCLIIVKQALELIQLCLMSTKFQYSTSERLLLGSKYVALANITILQNTIRLAGCDPYLETHFALISTLHLPSNYPFL